MGARGTIVGSRLYLRLGVVVQAAAAAYGAALGAPVPPLAITASLADRRPGAAIVPNGLPAPQDQIQLFM